MKSLCLHTYYLIIDDFSKKKLYDGRQIMSHYTAQEYGVVGNSILMFRGPMRLSPNEMIDIKDVLREKHLADILISSDDALHFIIEEFDIQPPNIEVQYYRLRILAYCVIEALIERGISIKRDGTDIYVDDKKLNVGIATIGKTSGKIHFGLNLTSTGAPDYVKIIGLKDLGFSSDELESFAMSIAEKYISEIKSIKNDCAKTRPI